MKKKFRMPTHKKEDSKTRCVNGHYVCNDCHTAGMDGIIGLCLAEDSKDPIGIINKMMDLPFCHMDGPEHHVMVGAALLAAYKNAGGEIDLHPALLEMQRFPMHWLFCAIRRHTTSGFSIWI